MFALKPLSHEAVSSALAKAEHYRLLNEAAEAESICRDVLEIEPGNQRALICLVLALSDQIHQNPHAFADAIQLAGRLDEEYDRSYYSGIVWERRAKARYHEGGMGAHRYVYEWMAEALGLFEKAEKLRPSGNEDAIIRWNTCVRFLSGHPHLMPRGEEEAEPILSE
jgi:hypothetical protein